MSAGVRRYSISYAVLSQLGNTPAVENYVKVKLKAAGFNFAVEIDSWRDDDTKTVVFEQRCSAVPDIPPMEQYLAPSPVGQHHPPALPGVFDRATRDHFTNRVRETAAMREAASKPAVKPPDPPRKRVIDLED